MKLFKKSSTELKTADVVAALQSSVSIHGSHLTDAKLADHVCGFESLGEQEQTTTSDAMETMIQLSKDAGVDKLLAKRLGTDDMQDSRIQKGLQAAALTMAANANPAAYQHTYTQKLDAASGTQVLDSVVPGVHNTLQFSAEAFDGAKFDDFVYHSAVANAMAAAITGIADAFFPQVIVAPGNSGIQVDVRHPVIYSNTKRNSSGGFELKRNSLVEAIKDHTLLEAASTKIYPVGSADNAPYLTATTDVPNRNVVVNGTDVEVRPIAFDKQVDLIKISAHEGLIGSAQMDHTDALSPTIYIGDIYVKVVNAEAGSEDIVIKLPLNQAPGTLFSPQADGTPQDMSVAYTGKQYVTNESVSLNGNATTTAAIDNRVGVGANDAWSLELDIKVYGDANFETANMTMTAGPVALSNVYTNGNTTPVAKTSTAFTQASGSLTFSLVGFEPAASRINSNMRDQGHIIDNSSDNRYTLPIKHGGPLTSMSPPTGDGAGTSVEDLTTARLIRSSNDAVTTLIQAAAAVKKADGRNDALNVLGSSLVTPSYVYSVVNMDLGTRVNDSSDVINDLAGHLCSAVQTAADNLIVKSGYKAALEVYSGTNSNYEIIVATDSHIANLLYRSGDLRAMGAKHNFRVTESNDSRMKGKIYVSFRRTDTDGPDPLSFGCQPTMPPLIFKADTTRNATVTELQMIPRENHIFQLPVIAELDVTNLDDYFDNQ